MKKTFPMITVIFQAICRPLAHYRSDRYRRPNCLAAVAWFLALACSSPQLYIWHMFVFWLKI